VAVRGEATGTLPFPAAAGAPRGRSVAPGWRSLLAPRRVLRTYGATIVALVVLAGLVSMRQRALPEATLIAAASALAFQALAGQITGQRGGRAPYYSAVITGLLIGVVLPPETSPLVVVGAVGLGLGSKFVLRVGDAAVLNPAAVGLLLPLGVLEISPTSWAVPGISPPWGLVLAIPVLVSVVATQRAAVAVTFGAAYAILTLVLSGLVPEFSAPWMMTLLASGYFAVALIMVTDPKTSPVPGPGQAAFGAGVGLLTFLLAATGAHDPFLYALLLGNLCSAASRHRARLRRAWTRIRAWEPWTAGAAGGQPQPL
jgi:Na+-translocating ferredoxin:NAD+ oxidoreductase RnfD subunit